MSWCETNHKTILGCIIGVVLFVALHAAPIGIVLPFLIHKEANADEAEDLLFLKVFTSDGLVIYHTKVANRDCLVGVAEGGMARTISIECLGR